MDTFADEISFSITRIGRIVTNNRGGNDLSLQTQNEQPMDYFYFNIDGILRVHNNNNNSGAGAGAEYEDSTLFQRTIVISCDDFFSNNNQDFLAKYLGNNQPYLPEASLIYLSGTIIAQVQTLCPQQRTNDKPPTFESQVIHFHLEIFAQMYNHDDDDDDVVVRMIPASNETIIQSLEKVPSLSESCTICMNEEEEEGDKEEVAEFSAMPCGHGFHHECIVQWLNTSHMCPVCRYALPTANDG